MSAVTVPMLVVIGREGRGPRPSMSSHAGFAQSAITGGLAMPLEMASDPLATHQFRASIPSNSEKHLLLFLCGHFFLFFQKLEIMLEGLFSIYQPGRRQDWRSFSGWKLIRFW